MKKSTTYLLLSWVLIAPHLHPFIGFVAGALFVSASAYFGRRGE